MKSITKAKCQNEKAKRYFGKRQIIGIVTGLLLCLISMNNFSRSILEEVPSIILNDTIESVDSLEFRKNSIYFENNSFLFFSINYERLAPLRNENLLSFSLGAGAFWDIPAISGRVSYSIGGIKHYFETGVVSYYQGEYIGGVSLGYRYQGHKGLLFRIPISITNNLEEDPVWFWFGFSIGYSF